MSRIEWDGRLRDRRCRWAIVVVGTAWMLVVGTGTGALHSYEFTPGGRGSSRADWPFESAVEFDRTRANLVMLAHPRCPCTRASVEELASLIEDAGDSLSCHVLFFVPDGPDRSWGVTESRRRAVSIPGVRVLDDINGQEAVRFGAETSGHVLVFDRTGRRLYSGGITGARGRLGDNVGRRTVSAILNGAGAAVPQPGTDCPTFGCPLLDPETRQTGRMLSNGR